MTKKAFSSVALVLLMIFTVTFAYAAGVAQPVPGGQVLYDFEYSELASTSFTDSLHVPMLGLLLAGSWSVSPSTTALRISDEQAAEGEYALQWTWDRNDWSKPAGMWFGSVHIPGFGEWADMTHLGLWAYGTGKTENFNITLVDAGGEKWYTKMKVDFVGWKQIEIPLDKFEQAPKGWQAKDADFNNVRDLPYTQLSLEPDSLGAGEVWFDLIEVYKK